MRSAPRRIKRWFVALAVACIALELVYLVAANAMLRGDFMSRLINRKPEKTHVAWTSAQSWLPGVVTVQGLTMRGQSRRVQWYLEVQNARARISLLGLAAKRFRVARIAASDVDFRLRRRIDVQREDDVEPKPIHGVEFFPEIPGLTNPPDPKPEDLYPRKKKRHRPWTVDLRGVHIDGSIRVAVDRIRVEGEGVVAGALTYRLRDSIRIRRAVLDMTSTRLLIDGELASDNLALDVDSRWRAFPPKGTKLPQVVGGISGTLAIAGDLYARASVPVELVPGLPISGTGHLDTTLHLRDGVPQPGSTYSLTSDTFRVGLLGLTAVGSATLDGSTSRSESTTVTELTVDLGAYQFVDPTDASVGIEGSGLTVRAVWKALSLADRMTPETVDVELPRADIHDVGVLGDLLPPLRNVSIDSGTGSVSGRITVDGSGTAHGQIDVEAQEIEITAQDVPLQADLTVHAQLDRGDLRTRAFDVSDTTVSLANVVDRTSSPSKDQEPWWSTVELDQGSVVLVKPLAARGSVTVRMHDTRPVVALISELTSPPKWLSLLPNVKNVEGTMDVTVNESTRAADDITITGESLEILGWLHVADKRPDGRIFIKYKGLAAGIGFVEGRSKMHLAKPRQWFDEQGTSAD